MTAERKALHAVGVRDEKLHIQFKPFLQLLQNWRFCYYKNRQICLRLLLSITAGSLGERWEAEIPGNLPKEESMKQINPLQAAMTQ